MYFWRRAELNGREAAEVPTSELAREDGAEDEAEDDDEKGR